MTDKSSNQPQNNENKASSVEDAISKTIDATATEQSTMQPEEQVLSPLESAQKEVAQLTDMLKRVQAEFSNYQKRQEQQSRQMVTFSTQRIITKLIPLYDMFSLSIQHKENVAEFTSGVEMIHDSFSKLLTDEQVVVPELVGQKFDPKVAQAVGTRFVKGTPAGIVLEQTSRAYVLGERTIKYATVIVSAAEESSSEASKK